MSRGDAAPMPANPLLDVDVVPERSSVRVVPAGEIDLSTAGALREQLDQLWESGWTDVVIDLRQVTFMDSSGVHVLIAAHRHAAIHGLQLSVIDGNRDVGRVLEVTGVAQLVRTVPLDRSPS